MWRALERTTWGRKEEDRWGLEVEEDKHCGPGQDLHGAHGDTRRSIKEEDGSVRSGSF
jgi:hypothetical protein